ncbi:MAG: hypothetical protein WBE26_01505 [Phycisphaerae bacterium]
MIALDQRLGVGTRERSLNPGGRTYPTLRRLLWLLFLLDAQHFFASAWSLLPYPIPAYTRELTPIIGQIVEKKVSG